MSLVVSAMRSVVVWVMMSGEMRVAWSPGWMRRLLEWYVLLVGVLNRLFVGC